MKSRMNGDPNSRMDHLRKAVVLKQYQLTEEEKKEEVETASVSAMALGLITVGAICFGMYGCVKLMADCGGAAVDSIMRRVAKKRVLEAHLRKNPVPDALKGIDPALIKALVEIQGQVLKEQ